MLDHFQRQSSWQWLRRATQPERRFQKSGAMSSEYSLAFGEDWAETLTVGNLAWPQRANRRAVLPRVSSTAVVSAGQFPPRDGRPVAQY